MKRHAERRWDLLKAVTVIGVFSLHNAWNCFVFLDFNEYEYVKDLLNINDSQVGFINSMGWVGIISTLPLVTVCKWPRALLLIAGLINAFSPALRFYAAKTKSYSLMWVSSLAIGSVYGVIGAWPPLLASLMLPHRPESWTLVTAIASLANYAGGAIGTSLLPAIINSADDLVEVLRMQTLIGIGLGVLLLSWLMIPRIPDNGSTLGACAELKFCWKARSEIIIFGSFIGISLLGQSMNAFIIHDSGFSDFEGGLANSLYQLLAAVSGIAIGAIFSDNAQVIRLLHAIAAVSYASLATICWFVSRSMFPYATEAMLVSISVLGGSLMGALPFILQVTIEKASPASENMVCGLILLVAMSIAAGMTQAVSILPVMTSIMIIGGMLFLELASYFSFISTKSDNDRRLQLT